MKIRCVCPTCGRSLAVPASLAESVAVCPACQSQFRVPAELTPPPPAPQPAPTATRVLRVRTRPHEQPIDEDAGSEPEESEDEPVRRRRKIRRRKKGGSTQTWFKPLGIGLAVVGVYTLAVLGLSLIHSGAAAILLILAGTGVTFAGSMWFFVVAFQESTSEGVLCAFVPFYPIYYTATRFGTVWPTLVVQFTGLPMSLLGIAILAKRAIVS